MRREFGHFRRIGFWFQMRLFGASRTNPDVELPRPEAVPSRDRVSTAHGRIIIAGTGRAGTTFLVQMLTALGFGTGFARDQSFQEVDEISHSGLEKALVDEDNPYHSEFVQAHESAARPELVHDFEDHATGR
jgi:hypothetical protein